MDAIFGDLDAIKAALEARPNPTITGGQLSALIRDVAPALDIRSIVGIPKGPGALSEFIRRHLSDVVERIGNQGGDILHQIRGREVAKLPAAASPQIWRTFVSPNSSQHLILAEGSRLLAVRDTPPDAAGEVEVAKASPEEHDKIRADFEASLSEERVTALREHVATNTDFETRISALREHLPEAVRQWGAFRRRRLSALFIARITGLTIDKSLRQDALEQIAVAERAVYETPKAGKSPSEKHTAQRAAASDHGAEALRLARRVARAAIDRLDYDELRALRMPLGAVLDAVQAEA